MYKFFKSSRKAQDSDHEEEETKNDNLPDSTEIFVAGILDCYLLLSNQLETVCLSEFASIFTFCKCSRREHNCDDEEEERGDDNLQESEVTIPFRDGSGFVKKRTKLCITRYRKFSPAIASEMVMFYYPWRNKQQYLIQNDNKRTGITYRILID